MWGAKRKGKGAERCNRNEQESHIQGANIFYFVGKAYPASKFSVRVVCLPNAHLTVRR